MLSTTGRKQDTGKVIIIDGRESWVKRREFVTEEEKEEEIQVAW